MASLSTLYKQRREIVDKRYEANYKLSLAYNNAVEAVKQAKIKVPCEYKVYAGQGYFSEENEPLYEKVFFGETRIAYVIAEEEFKAIMKKEFEINKKIDDFKKGLTKN